MTFGITCHRTAASMFGAASAPLKEDGKRVTFATYAEAQAEAARLNARTSSPSVYYRADSEPSQ